MAGNALKVGRYALGDRIASGGMATVHLGRLDGSAGFSRTVAIKRLHPHLCEDPSFTGAFADEARLAARIRHPNVVPTLDVVSTEGELLIVMEYVDGDSLSSLVRKVGTEKIPFPIVVAIVSEMLHGLHSAHEAKSESGKPLDIVHRDVSPQNVLVGADGVVRLVDFGIARASSKNRQAQTGENDLKGKLAYMAPEQIRREDVSRRTDIYAAGIVLWELLTGDRLFASDNEAATMEKILVGWVQPPRTIRMDVPESLNEITLRALDPDPNNRFDTARDMAVALEDALHRALGREVGAWVEKVAADTLATRRAMIATDEKENRANPTHTDLSAAAVQAFGPALSDSIEAPTTPRQEKYAKPMQPTLPERNLRAALIGTDPQTGPGQPLVPMHDDLQTGPGLVTRPGRVNDPRLVTGPPHMSSPLMLETLASVASGTPGAPLGMEYERTVTSFGEELAYPPPPPPKRSRTDRLAYAALGLAVIVTIAVALSWSKIGGSPHAASSGIPDSPPPLLIADPQPPPQPPASAPEPEKVAEKPVEKVDKPVDKPDRPGGSTQFPAIRPIIRPKPKAVGAAKQPCTSKLDPATGRTVYQGDCN